MIGGAKGIGIGLDFGIGNIKRPTKQSSLDPAIKEALCGVWIADQNTNESPTRNIIKNKLKDRGGDFEIRNAAYNGNSGYSINNDAPFTQWTKVSSRVESNVSIDTIHITKIIQLKLALYYISDLRGKVKYKVTGVSEDKSIKFGYDGSNVTYEVIAKRDGIYEVDWDLNVNSIGNKVANCIIAEGTTGDCNITIEQIPYYQGAFCTDGVDDMIVSKKPVSEILGGSNEITVVSMMANLDSRQILCNSIFSNVATYNVRNLLEANNVTTILGYTDKDGTITNLNLIMGDKNSIGLTDKVNFNSIYGFYPTAYHSYYYKVAWYWTFIAKRVLTTDEINQVIAYYNLDKYVAPDIYYDVKKQGLTNENHAEFGDKLIDYSGNGKDMQLYNFGWKLDSGVGKYEEDFNKWAKYPNVITNAVSVSTNLDFKSDWLVYRRSSDNSIKGMKIRVSGIPKNGILTYRYAKQNDSIVATELFIIEDGIYELPESKLTTAAFSIGFNLSDNDWTKIYIEQLPSYENALVFDGVDDYGMVDNLPIYKDYTVIADREIVDGLINNADGSVATKGANIADGAFCFDYKDQVFSFGGLNSSMVNTKRFISYQSKHVWNGSTISIGNVTDKSFMSIARMGNNVRYSKLALWSFMLFPYSLSEFLIERQLKKRKLGTLHPVVKFNPIIEGNEPFEILKYHKITADNAYLDVTKGEYIPIGHEIGIAIKLSDNTFKLTKVTSSSLTDINFGMPPGTPYATIIGTLTDKSPQDIEIYIENNQQGGGEPVIDFTTWIKGNNATMTCTPTTIHLTNMTAAGMVIETKSIDLVLPSIKVRVSGVQKGRGVAFQYNKPDGTFNLYWCETDGEHTIPSSVHTEKQQYTIIKTNFAGDCDILVEVLT